MQVTQFHNQYTRSSDCYLSIHDKRVLHTNSLLSKRIFITVDRDYVSALKYCQPWALIAENNKTIQLSAVGLLKKLLNNRDSHDIHLLFKAPLNIEKACFSLNFNHLSKLSFQEVVDKMTHSLYLAKSAACHRIILTCDKHVNVEQLLMLHMSYMSVGDFSIQIMVKVYDNMGLFTVYPSISAALEASKQFYPEASLIDRIDIAWSNQAILQQL